MRHGFVYWAVVTVMTCLTLELAILAIFGPYGSAIYSAPAAMAAGITLAIIATREDW